MDAAYPWRAEETSSECFLGPLFAVSLGLASNAMFSATSSIRMSVASITGPVIRACFITMTSNRFMLTVKKLCLLSMKPTRIRMCHSLVMNYGLYKKMEIFVS